MRTNPNFSRRLTIVFSLCLVFASSLSTRNFAQTSSPTPASSTSDAQKIDFLIEQQQQLIQRLDKKDAEIAELKARYESTTSNVFFFAGILGTVLTTLLAIGTGFSITGFIKSEKRATEAHSFALSSARDAENRAAAGFSLALIGEADNQKRAAQVHENFLTGSKETLELVNATLTLAKEASERAAKMIERRARAIVDELDRESQFLLASVPAQDDRALIANPASRSNLRSVAHKITGFEINRFILPEDIQLTPPCLFIRGMDFHLSQQFEDAINNWETVALSPSASDNLKSLAWYWIGYEQNNLNRFDEGEQSFENALKSATGERTYELQRILIETKFFNKKKKNYRSDAMIQPLKNLLNSLPQVSSEELEARRTKILITLGNVISETARGLTKTDRDSSLNMFKQAKECFEQVSERDKWARFGLAEVLYALGEVETAREMFRTKVREAAIDESVRREEPRTKVLARTTELICCLCEPDLHKEAPGIRSLVLQELGRVDERLTVYSQIQKRNVTKTEFQDDLDELMAQFPLST
jgi:tetratricopeptide (TPR) repeat protein